MPTARALVDGVRRVWDLNLPDEEWVVRFLKAVGSDPDEFPPEAAAPFPKLAVSGDHSAGFEAIRDDLAERIGALRAVVEGAGHEVQVHRDAPQRGAGRALADGLTASELSVSPSCLDGTQRATAAMSSPRPYRAAQPFEQSAHPPGNGGTSRYLPGPRSCRVLAPRPNIGDHACMPLFGRRKKAVDPSPQQAVLVHIMAPSDGEISLDVIEGPLMEAIDAAGVGEFDGNLIGPEDAILYMYGPDANRLFAVVEPILRDASLPAGSYVVLQYGGPGAEERRIDL